MSQILVPVPVTVPAPIVPATPPAFVKLYHPETVEERSAPTPEPPPPDQVGPQMELLKFLREVVAIENTDLASGSSASLSDYVTQVNNLQKYFDAARLAANLPLRPLLYSDVNKALLAAAMKWMLSRGRAIKTCNKLRRTILAIYNFGRDEKEFEVPRVRLKKYKEAKTKPRCWSAKEVLSILQAARQMPGSVGTVPAGVWHLAHILFLLNTGSRITAAMETPSACLDLENGWVTIPADVQKHDSDELIDLHPMTVEALRAIEPHRHQRIFDDWPHDRTQRQWPALNLAMRKILVRAGLCKTVNEATRRDLHHKMRRCFVTFVTAREGRQAAQELVGHSHPSVTDLYIDARFVSRPSASQVMSQFVGARQMQLFEQQ